MMIVSEPQLEKPIEIGAMKSLISELNDVEERDFTYAEENGSHVPGGTMPAQVRLIAASPNCCGGRLTVGLARVSSTATELVAPSEHAEEIACPVPQLLPFQM